MYATGDLREWNNNNITSIMSCSVADLSMILTKGSNLEGEREYFEDVDFVLHTRTTISKMVMN